MYFQWIDSLLAVVMFLGMLAMIGVGRRLGMAWLAKDPEGLAKGVGASEGAIFALFGLIIAFTFSGAATRFEDRRHLITEEVNDIGTAYLRIELLPKDAQPELRDLFRRYLDLRLATFANFKDLSIAEARLAETATLQDSIWKKAVAACQRPDNVGRPEVLVVPALNAMFDITTTRKAATQNHPPVAIFVLLAGMGLIASMLVGYDISANKQRAWLHSIVFAVIMSLSIYLIIDLEFPRMGLIRIDAADQLMIDLRKSMN